MRHEMLTQRTFLAITRNTKRYAESAFCDVPESLEDFDHVRMSMSHLGKSKSWPAGDCNSERYVSS